MVVEPVYQLKIRLRQLKTLSKLQAAIEEDLEIGNGHGPINHWAYQKCQHSNIRQ